MSNLVIVAIPDENDRVWKVSSEKIPHLTLLYLGEASEVNNIEQIVRFVEHAAKTTLNRFYLPVDRRGSLGEDEADVLFFRKGRWGYREIRDFRVQLLKNDAIRTAYDSAQQHEGPWTPHLTLGYKDKPAKADDTDRDFGFYDVAFNKIAVWIEDYDGPEFDLKDPWDEWETLETSPVDVAMSDQADAYILEHYGVKGMKWGVRKQETKGAAGTAKRWFDPEGHDLATDVAKNIVFGLVAAPLAIPSSVRLTRGAYRGAKAKAQDIAEKHDDKKFERVAKSQQAFVAIHNGSIEKFNADIAKVNKRYSEADLKNPAKQKAYDKEVQRTMQEAYKDSANRIGNKSGTKHLDVEFQPNGEDFAIKVREGQQKPTIEKAKVAHAAIDDDDVVTFVGKFVRDDAGYIQGMEFEDFAPNPVVHSAELGAEFMVFNGLMSPDHFLEHYGVKGMHWGVRREDVEKAAGSTTSKVGQVVNDTYKFAKDVEFEARTAKRKDEFGNDSHSEADEMVMDAAHKPYKDHDLPAIKERHPNAGFKTRLLKPLSAEAKAYRKDARETYIKRLETTANSMKNASGTREYTIRERGGDLPKSKYSWEVSTREAKHAAGENTYILDVIMDEDGYITDLKRVSSDNSMAQSMADGAYFLAALGIMDDDDLQHYGVKGMRWGVRRNREAPLAVTPVARSRVPHGTKRKTKVEVEGGQNHEASPDAIKVAEHKQKLKRSGVHALSNNELRELNQRLQLETQAAQLTSNRANKFIQRQLEQTGQQVVQRNLKVATVKKVAKKAGKGAATAATIALI